LTVDRHFTRVAAECADVGLHPFKGLHLVEETGVEGADLGSRECGMGEEAEDGEAVVDRDDDDIGRLVDPMIERPFKSLISVNATWITVAYQFAGLP
jgi:hypothetical protein